MAHNKPEVQDIIDELHGNATSPADRETLAEWQTELDEARRETLGSLGEKATKLATLPDGTVTTESEVEAAKAAGQEPSHPYGAKARR
jgi:hypothetical protein